MQLLELPRQGEHTTAGISTCQHRQLTQLGAQGAKPSQLTVLGFSLLSLVLRGEQDLKL